MVLRVSPYSTKRARHAHLLNLLQRRCFEVLEEASKLGHIRHASGERFCDIAEESSS